MNLEADRLLLKYFRENIDTVEGWFNIISPTTKTLVDLKSELILLKNKNWINILA